MVKFNLNIPKDVKKLIVIAFFLRLLVFFIVLLLQNTSDFGFISNEPINDDARFLLASSNYNKIAHSVIDKVAFTSSFEAYGDYSGYKLTIPLWQWIVCIVGYISGTNFTIRLITIFLSSISIVYLFNICRIILGEKSAIIASKIWALLPYPVIFACSPYKDHLVLIAFWGLLLNLIKYSNNIRLSKIELFSVPLYLFIYFNLRSGISIIAVAVLFGYFLFKRNRKINKLNLLILALVGIYGIYTTFVYSWDSILLKTNYYVLQRVDGSNTLAFFNINSITDIWKLPFTYMISIIQPFGLTSEISAPISVVAISNILLIPMMFANFLYLFFYRSKYYYYWPILVLYLITIVSSISIFRHYYYLLPFHILSFAALYNSINWKKFKLLISCLSIFTLLVFIYYFSQK